MLYDGAACGILGAVSGVAFAALWQRLVPRGTGRRFWSSLFELTRQMMRVDETSDILHCYRRLAGLLAAYLARNLGGAAVACLPMIFILVTVAPLVSAGWDGKAERLAVVPSAAGEILTGAGGPALRLKGADRVRPLAVAADPTGFCRSSDYCALFTVLGFEVVELDAAPQRVPYIVVRADHGDVNPFWPFLSDVEFAFFAAFILSTIACLLWPSAPRS